MINLLPTVTLRKRRNLLNLSMLHCLVLCRCSLTLEFKIFNCNFFTRVGNRIKISFMFKHFNIHCFLVILKIRRNLRNLAMPLSSFLTTGFSFFLGFNFKSLNSISSFTPFLKVFKSNWKRKRINTTNHILPAVTLLPPIEYEFLGRQS
ncbi:hypothetical protein VIGAN_UM060700 [Vigna angularis var. angularis]|uniref:Uncharacterized protein n=1 Tax=Vigna angularis var. angularis TaxID=157739 RepID=A0A0S3TE72_PHAAN|nr:hypothetical protein VIGAN_UM060700 [Vigna angularis var. angularis]